LANSGSPGDSRTQLFGYLDGSIPEPVKELETRDKDGAVVKIPNPEYVR
jgi:hypothetical protein